MIPCIKNKCILLPICKGKFEIECHELAEYYGKRTDGTYISGSHVWYDIQEVFPKLQEIMGPLKRSKTLVYRTFKIYKHPDPGRFVPKEF